MNQGRFEAVMCKLANAYGLEASAAFLVNGPFRDALNMLPAERKRLTDAGAPDDWNGLMCRDLHMWDNGTRVFRLDNLGIPEFWLEVHYNPYTGDAQVVGGRRSAPWSPKQAKAAVTAEGSKLTLCLRLSDNEAQLVCELEL